MSYNRRTFLKTGTAIASGLAITSFTNGLIGCQPTSKLKGINNVFGLQLYSLRDVIPKDPKGVLKQVASFGYKQLESYEHDTMGIYFGMKNTEFKSFIDDHGMTMVSSHCKYNQDLERKADEAAAIGMKYLLCPWLGAQKTLDAYKKFAETFNKCGEVCKERGLRFGYHNHDYSFKLVEGQYPQDILMQNTDKALVDFEMDMYWVVRAAQDPIAWFKKYPDRFRLGHVKDHKESKTATLGTGTINYPAILKEAEKEGMKYFVVEQEHYEGTTSIAAVRDDAEYMKKLKL